MTLDPESAVVAHRELRPLPVETVQLLRQIAAPPRLTAHLRLVHDMAAQLVEALAVCAPELGLDSDAVLLGAAMHGLPDCLLVEEFGGAEWERLVHPCVDESLGRYAAERAEWMELDVSVEDLVVFLADKIWKGRRDPSLEGVVVDQIGAACGFTPQQAFAAIDPTLSCLAADGAERVAFQMSYPSHDEKSVPGGRIVPALRHS